MEFAAGVAKPKRADLDQYELWLRSPQHPEARYPEYVDVIDLALMFKRNPQEIFEEWDELWIERISLVLEARRLAAVVHDDKKLEGK